MSREWERLADENAGLRTMRGALEAEIERLRDALEPFGRFGVTLRASEANGDLYEALKPGDVVASVSAGGQMQTWLTVEQFDAAAALRVARDLERGN